MHVDRTAETARKTDQASKKAIEILEQAYAYYTAETIVVTRSSEYYEYVPAA